MEFQLEVYISKMWLCKISTNTLISGNKLSRLLIDPPDQTFHSNSTEPTNQNSPESHKKKKKKKKKSEDKGTEIKTDPHNLKPICAWPGASCFPPASPLPDYSSSPLPPDYSSLSTHSSSPRSSLGRMSPTPSVRSSASTPPWLPHRSRNKQRPPFTASVQVTDVNASLTNPVPGLQLSNSGLTQHGSASLAASHQLDAPSHHGLPDGYIQPFTHHHPLPRILHPRPAMRFVLVEDHDTQATSPMRLVADYEPPDYPQDLLHGQQIDGYHEYGWDYNPEANSNIPIHLHDAPPPLPTNFHPCGYCCGYQWCQCLRGYNG